ncbi:uncharacterized protein LOC127264942 [Andrographis paniculata]|uniref:uncharacterized protein LOC127264942 n=1 Tax=Andrographis paniculata TaxID=175694 RepID=UPI0021E7ADD1|nr:uncharacterized protein LOC127264942 [Andrographis paniculata]
MRSLYNEYVEDFVEEEHGSLAKRSRLGGAHFSQLSSCNTGLVAAPAPAYNPLCDPPLGLQLRKTPSLLDLIQMQISKESNASTPATSNGVSETRKKRDSKTGNASSANDKLKASNFPAKLLRIGTWEYVSKYEGDLVAKCYFAKHKIVWEVLEDGLKLKIEIQWSDITGLKADFPENESSSLTVVLARKPVFFRETNPQPRKHTLWQASEDFTDGQASVYLKHYIECSSGMLNKHYEKLIQCDTRLAILSKQPELVIDSPCLEPETSSVPEISEESKGDGLPSSVVDMTTINTNRRMNNQQIPSAIPDPANNDAVSKQANSGTFPSDEALEYQGMLESVSQALLSDAPIRAMGLDENSLMKKVNSLCCLLEIPGAMAAPIAPEESAADQGNDKFATNMSTNAGHGDGAGSFLKTNNKDSAAPLLPRNDSLNDFLQQFPPIASLPIISENDEEYRSG